MEPLKELHSIKTPHDDAAPAAVFPLKSDEERHRARSKFDRFFDSARVMIAQNPRPLECVTFQIAVGIAIMLYEIPHFLLGKPELWFSIVEDFWSYQIEFATFVAALAGSQLLGLIGLSRKLRRIVMALHSFCAMVFFLMVILIPPTPSPSDILFWTYFFCASTAFLQLRYGRPPG